MKLALAQIASLYGNFDKNAEEILRSVIRAQEQSASLCICPLGAFCGQEQWVWSRDLSFEERMQDTLSSLVQKLHEVAPNQTVIFGLDQTRFAVVQGGTLHIVPARSEPIFIQCVDEVVSVQCALSHQSELTQVLQALPEQANIRVVLDARAYNYTLPLLTQRVQDIKNLVWMNAAGAQDEWVYAGGSFCTNNEGRVIALCDHFESDYAVVDEDTEALTEVPVNSIALCYRALKESLKAYLSSTGFKTVQLGLSGGVDSALVAAIATEVLGPKNVYTTMLKTEFTSEESVKLAQQLATNLGVHFSERDITPLFKQYQVFLADDFEGLGWDNTEENLQARIRAMVLMALSNKFGRLLLSTGNKTEAAVGYCTLYGDTCGGFALLKDLLKEDVWQLCRYHNSIQGAATIPVEIIERPPTAELRHGQRDEDSLLPYVMLDAIVRAVMEEGLSLDAIVERGFDREKTGRIYDMIFRNEFKRSQMAIGPRVRQDQDWKCPQYTSFIPSHLTK